MKKLILSGILFLTSINTLQAQSSFGNITSINTAGKFTLKLEGAKVDQVKTVMPDSTLHATVGNVQFQIKTYESTNKLEQESIGIGLGYSITDQFEVFGGLSDGDQTQEGDIRSDDFFAYKLGFSFVPSQQGRLKMGILAQAERVDTTYRGDYPYPVPYLSYSTATDTYNMHDGIVAGEEKVTLTSFDIHIGFSVELGVVKSYFGLFANKISGDYSFSGSGMNTVFSYPINGGVGTSTNELVTMKMDASLEEKDMFGGVLGISFQPLDNFSADVEVQAGAREGFFFIANYLF